MTNLHICKRCGECCRLSPKLEKSDIKRIKKLKIEEHFFIETINNVPYMKIENNKCVFLEKKDHYYKCTIYNERPKICREYPNINLENCQPEKSKIDQFFEK